VKGNVHIDAGKAAIKEKRGKEGGGIVSGESRDID